jgi:hypothetical protein
MIPGCCWLKYVSHKAVFSLVQLGSLRHTSTQEDDQTIRRKHAPAAGKWQIHARISRSESGRHALRTHTAHASPLTYCCPYECNQRMCHIACVVAQVETQPYVKSVLSQKTYLAVILVYLYGQFVKRNKMHSKLCKLCGINIWYYLI